MVYCKKTCNIFLSIFIIILLTVFSSFGQETSNKSPQGRPRALIFTNFNKNFEGETKSSAFEILRAYLGYEYSFNAEWYGYIVFDVGDPEGGEHEYSAFLKNAYIRYSKSDLTFLFGMVPTTQFKVAEDIWGLRYVDEVFQDLYGFSSSADLGFTVKYDFSDLISADFSVFNGEGYHNLQSDDYLQPALGITLKPSRTFTGRFYGDLMGGAIKQYSYSGFVAYEDNSLTVGAEYNYQKNVDMLAGRDRFGPSFFITYSPVPNIMAFSRFDYLSSNILHDETEPWQITNDGKLLMVGLEYQPTRGVKFAPNYRLWKPSANTMVHRHSIFLNCEIRF